MMKVPCIVVLLGVLSSAALASSGPNCGQFEVRLTNGDMRLVDADKDGPSVGDHRVGTYDIVDADGSVIGMHIVDLTIVSVQDGMSYLSGDVSGVYDKGTIHYHIIAAAGDPSIREVRAGQAPTKEYSVIGGTGIFSGAFGTVTAADSDDGYRVHRFNLSCAS